MGGTLASILPRFVVLPALALLGTATLTFAAETQHGGKDEGDRGLRYLEWTWDPDPSDETYVIDFAYLVREEDGSVRLVHDRHVCGLFPRAEWLRLLEDVGFQAKRRVIDREEDKGTEAFIGLRPPTSG